MSIVAVWKCQGAAVLLLIGWESCGVLLAAEVAPMPSSRVLKKLPFKFKELPDFLSLS